MSLFDVVEPCAFLAADGRAVHHTRPGAVGVEIDDREAAPLVEAGKLVPHAADTAPADKPPSDIAQKPFPADVTPDAVPETPEPEDGDEQQPEPHGRRGHRSR